MSSKWPSPTEAWAALEAAGPPAWVLDHVACVERLALAMADAAIENGRDVDRDLVQIGSILHDIGRSITQDPTHAHQGARMLAGDWPKEVVRIVERHTGAGLDADEAARLGLPSMEMIPATLEERIVCHADNLWSGSRRLDLAAIEGKYRAKGLDDAWERIAALHASLTEELGCDPSSL